MRNVRCPLLTFAAVLGLVSPVLLLYKASFFLLLTPATSLPPLRFVQMTPSVYPKRSSKQHFVNLVKQCEDVGIPFLDAMPDDAEVYDVIVDAIFGFSFHGEPREPFATILKQMKSVKEKNPDAVAVVAVDIPSGWNVDEGDVAKTGFVPDVLVSLTAPKLCAKAFNGRHYVGGRFLPPALGDKYGKNLVYGIMF